MEISMPAHQVGILHHVKPHLGITASLERIDATLGPFGSRFIVHGGDPEIREGHFNTGSVVIEFAGVDEVRACMPRRDTKLTLSLRAAHSNSVCRWHRRAALTDLESVSLSGQETDSWRHVTA
jgi:uncharacterized protein (DUF1330 family)